MFLVTIPFWLYLFGFGVGLATGYAMALIVLHNNGKPEGGLYARVIGERRQASEWERI